MRQFKITVNGKAYDVNVEEKVGSAAAPAPAAPVAAPTAAPAPVAAPAPAVAEAGEGAAVEAPMPGTILKVLVSAGQSVSKGDTLLILEAMKMENEITAPSDGTVSAVCVAAGDAVEVGKTLVTIK